MSSPSKSQPLFKLPTSILLLILCLVNYFLHSKFVHMSSDNQLRTIFQAITKNINEDMDDFGLLKSICKKYNQQTSHVVLIAVVVILFLTLTGIFQHAFVTIFGLLYPAYMSFKAINAESDEKSKIWLTYWIVFGLVTAFDKLLGVILFFLPGYYFVKCIFYIWMFYPRTNGAQLIYQRFLKPQLVKFKQLADKKFD